MGVTNLQISIEKSKKNQLNIMNEIGQWEPAAIKNIDRLEKIPANDFWKFKIRKN